VKATFLLFLLPFDAAVRMAGNQCSGEFARIGWCNLFGSWVGELRESANDLGTNLTVVEEGRAEWVLDGDGGTDMNLVLPCLPCCICIHVCLMHSAARHKAAGTRRELIVLIWQSLDDHSAHRMPI
jgi:hypothetical protein